MLDVASIESCHQTQAKKAGQILFTLGRHFVGFCIHIGSTLLTTCRGMWSLQVNLGSIRARAREALCSFHRHESCHGWQQYPRKQVPALQILRISATIKCFQKSKRIGRTFVRLLLGFSLVQIRYLTSDSCDRVFHLLVESNTRLDSATYASLLSWCAHRKALSDGKCVHDHIVANGFAQCTFLESLLVQMYGKCGAPDQALVVFAQMHEHTPFSWNFIIRACAQHGRHQTSLMLFDQMQHEGALPDRFTFVCAFSACAAAGNLHKGMQVHSQIVVRNIVLDAALSTSLVNMYGKCAMLKTAVLIFRVMPEQDEIAWNAMIAVYSHHMQGKQAFQLWSQMQEQGVLPTKVTFISIIDVCANMGDVGEGKRMHVQVLGNGLEPEMVVGNVLVNMYGKCGLPMQACEIFEEMSRRNVVSWTAMIAAFADYGFREEAFQLFSQMHEQCVLPQDITVVSVLSACDNHQYLGKGEQLHVYAAEARDMVVQTALLNMYGRCGRLDAAKRVFERAVMHDIVSWNAMITVYAQLEFDSEALQLLYQMQEEGVTPNAVTVISVVSALTSQSRLIDGKLVHAFSLENGLELEISAGNALVSMYGRCGSLEDAWSLFNSMPMRNVVAWNAMVAILTMYGSCAIALQILNQMSAEGVIPDKITAVSILETYSKLPTSDEQGQSPVLDYEHVPSLADANVGRLTRSGVLEHAQKVFASLHEHEVSAWNAMLAVHIQHGYIMEALLLLDRMRFEGVIPNSVSFGTLFSGFARQTHFVEGKKLLVFILKTELELDAFLGNAIMTMFGKCDHVREARDWFNRISSPNVVSWSTMISSYAQKGLFKEALALFLHMFQSDILPNKVTYANIFGAFANHGALDTGKKVHASINSMELASVVSVETAIVDMYAKCGCLENAQAIFCKMCDRDVLSWNTVVTLYGQYGLGKAALQMLDEMYQEGVLPDKVTFVNVLTACSHSGLIEEAAFCFDSMMQAHCFPPASVHYVCLVDLMGRAGRLDEARFLIDDMPHAPTGITFMALLGACKQQGDLGEGETAAMQLLELEPENAAPYVVLGNMYALEREVMHTS